MCEQYSHLPSNDKVLILTLLISECYKCWHLLTLHPLPTDLLEILTIAHNFCVAGHLWMCIYLLCRQQPIRKFLERCSRHVMTFKSPHFLLHFPELWMMPDVVSVLTAAYPLHPEFFFPETRTSFAPYFCTPLLHGPGSARSCSVPEEWMLPTRTIIWKDPPQWLTGNR